MACLSFKRAIRQSRTDQPIQLLGPHEPAIGIDFLMLSAPPRQLSADAKMRDGNKQNRQQKTSPLLVKQASRADTFLLCVPSAIAPFPVNLCLVADIALFGIAHP
jgi:hypothetical protein